MNVVLYNFTKRQNSTKQPNPAEGKYITCQLKDETSFLNPTLKISKNVVSGEFSPAVYNYVAIPYWQRYYFITDWQYLNGVWECSCSVDPLASFKAEIGNTSAYVIRSSYEFSGDVMDGIYPITTNSSIAVKNLGQMFDINHGCYILGITCCANTPYRIGSVVYYAMTQTELNDFLQFLYSDSIFNLSNITSIENGLFKAIMNPTQYIVSCIWVPLDATVITNQPKTEVTIGYWEANHGIYGRIVPMGNFGRHNHVELPSHPQISRGKYLNYAPYTRHTLYFPPFGGIPVDTSFKNIGNYLDAYVSVDAFTGQGNLRLCISTSTSGDPMTSLKIITERTSLCGVPIQISAAGTDFLNGVAGLVSSGISAWSGNYAGAANGLLSTGMGLTDQHPTSLGYNGSFLETFEQPILVSEFFRITDENRDEIGRPLCKTRKLSSIPGYIQVNEDDHAFSATKNESEIINRYLKSGFFYE